MRFAKLTFYIAGIWGILILAPLYFMFNLIGKNDPPAITHPGFYYGFVSAGLAWQIAFFVIAQDPVRFRPLIIPSILEKFGYAASFGVLYLEHRIHPADLGFAMVDVVFGIAFLAAFFATASGNIPLAKPSGVAG